MINPIDLIQQSAGVDVADLLDKLLRSGGSGPSNTFSKPPDFVSGAPTQFIAGSLDAFVNSPSPLPGNKAQPSGQFSSPQEFQPTGELVANADGGTTFVRPPPPQAQGTDPLAALSAAAGQGGAFPASPAINGAVANPVDQFNTPNPERTRELLRKLLDNL